MALSLSQVERFSTKIISWVDILHLIRTVSQRQSYRSQKNEVSTFRGFPGTPWTDFDKLGL